MVSPRARSLRTARAGQDDGGGSAGRRRSVVGLSLVVTLGAFAATTWWLGRWQGPGREGSPPPALGRAAPRVATSPPPPVSAPEDADAARRALVAAAAEAAEEAARAQVTGPALAADEPLEIRLDLYLASLRRALEASGNEALLAHGGVFTEHFLRLAPVQEDLAALSPAARADALARIRREMGFDPEQVERMARVDAERQARWDAGLAYMEERGRLARTFEGEALEEELRLLRERHFGRTAATIGREETQGFFRFERPRVYGRN